jgi:hypothetical protein
MQGVSLVRTGSTTPRAAQIAAGRLRLCLDPASLSFSLCDAQGSLTLSGITPRLEAEAPGGAALAIGPRRTLSVGELKGRGGPALRLEVQAVGRGFVGVRWTLEIAAAGDALACSLAVENRTAQRLELRTLAPLARGSLAPGTGILPTPLPVQIVRSPGDAFLALGFTTERRHSACVRLESEATPEPAFSLQHVLPGLALMPGEGVESERAWLSLGADEASLLAEWARLAGLDMEARAPGRAVLVGEASRHELPERVAALRQFADLVVMEPAEGAESGAREESAFTTFASEARALGALPGATLGPGPWRSREELAAECAALRRLGLEHVAARVEDVTLASVGLIETLRLPEAPGAAGVRRALDLGFSAQRLWRLDPGAALSPGGSPPTEQERTQFCVFALVGAALRVVGDPRHLDPVRARWLRLATPGLARPAAALPIPGGRAVVVSLVGERRAVLLVNESETTQSLGATFRSLGLTGPHHVFDFWNEEALGETQEALAPVPVEALGSRLFALTPVAPRAQVIGTTLHLGMGCLEAGGIRVREDGALGLTLRLPGPRGGAVWIAVPGEAMPRRIEVSFEEALSLALPRADGPR